MDSVMTGPHYICNKDQGGGYFCLLKKFTTKNLILKLLNKFLYWEYFQSGKNTF